MERRKLDSEMKAVAAPSPRKPRPPSSGAPSKKGAYGASRPSIKGSSKAQVRNTNTSSSDANRATRIN